MAVGSPQQPPFFRLDSIAGAFIALLLSFFGRQLADERMSPVDSQRWNDELAEDLYLMSKAVVGSEGEIEMNRFLATGFDLGQVDNYLAKGALLFAQNINDGTAQMIEDAIANGDDLESARNSALSGDAAEKRASDLANNKASHLQAFSSLEAAKQEGGEYTKTWVWSNLPNSRHELLAGQTVPVYMPFSNGLQYPHDPAGLPRQITNCKCSLRVNGVRNLEVLEGR